MARGISGTYITSAGGGEVVKAFVVLAPGHEPSSELVTTLQDHVKTTTAPYKYPRKIEFVPTLPKTVSGKIRRKELRDAEWQQGERPHTSEQHPVQDNSNA